MSNSKSFLNNLIGPSASSSSSHARSHSTPATNSSSKLCSGCINGSHDSPCLYCGDLYCKTCLIQKVSLSAGRSQWLCRRCVVFTGGELTWDSLITMSVKDLRWFLSRNKISDENVKEKEQLVELIIKHYGNDSRSSVREDDVGRSTHSRKFMDSKNPLQEPHQTLPTNDTQEINNETNAPESPNHFMKRPPPAYETLYPSSSSTTNPDNATNSAAENGVKDGPTVTVPPPVKKSNIHMINNKDQRIHLDEIESEEMLNQLSVKQLKDLLTCNFVNFKGCVERSELMSRAARLWLSHEENKRLVEEQNQRLFGGNTQLPEANEKPKTTDTSEEDKFCRICMENVIDCVFLDCGHMLTCVKCGKVLAECPVCRQNIVRVVRVFHS